MKTSALSQYYIVPQVWLYHSANDLYRSENVILYHSANGLYRSANNFFGFLL